MIKTNFDNIKVIHSFTTYLLCFLTCCGFSQSTEKQVIRVERMEFAYYQQVKTQEINYISLRVILAKDSIVARKMKQSIFSAINRRWNAIVTDSDWQLNPRSANSKTPNFDTNYIQVPGSWHLFFQVIDGGPYPLMDKKKNMFSMIYRSSPPFEKLDYAPNYMRFKALIIDSNDGSEIFSNEMTFEMQRDAIPDGQILLRKIPALPDSFLQAFDNAVQNFFSITPQKDLKLKVTPACLYLDVDKSLPNMKKLNFITKNDTVIEQLQLKQEWSIQNTKTKKIKRVNNWGVNTTNDALNVLFGLQTDHITSKIYNATFGFLNIKENKQYSCEIPFTEEKKIESDMRIGNWVIDDGGDETIKRIFDDTKKNYILCEKDTIGSFKIIVGNSTNYKNHFYQCWDGKTETSITMMPEFWFDSSSEQNRYTGPFFLEGEINNVPFVIENSKAGNQVDIGINGQEVAVFKIYNNKPVLGLLYSLPTDEKLFYLLMMLSSLPFNSIL